MHPFYGPSARLLGGSASREDDRGAQVAGLVSMAAYLAFWAGAVALGVRILNERFPRERAGALKPGAGDPAVAELRLRYARGEVDRAVFQQVLADLLEAGP
jgi:hypothetical protein